MAAEQEAACPRVRLNAWLGRGLTFDQDVVNLTITENRCEPMIGWLDEVADFPVVRFVSVSRHLESVQSHHAAPIRGHGCSNPAPIDAFEGFSTLSEEPVEVTQHYLAED